MAFKPMLAKHVELDKLVFPVLASPKLDGIRAVTPSGVILSRSLKLIPNKYIQKVLNKPELKGIDGELIVGDPTDPQVYHKTVSGVMTEKGKPNFKFYVFDDFTNPDQPYTNFDNPSKCRAETLYLKSIGNKHIVRVEQRLIHDLDDLLDFEDEMLNAGYEGIMVRSLDGKYKFGRSTVKQGYLLKLKRYLDSEAKILGFEEQMHNANEAKISETGKTKRSNHKANMIPKGTLGSLRVKDIYSGIEFNMSGFEADLAQEIWDNQKKYKGKIVKYKYFPKGMKDKPRHPNFLGFRDERDMS